MPQEASIATEKATCQDQRLRSNLSVMLSLVRLESDYPPLTAASALARVAGQIATLSAIYDGATATDGDESVDMQSWCASLIASIGQGLAKKGSIAYQATGRRVRIKLELAQALGLVLGELMADASDRARRSGREPKIDVELATIEGGRYMLRVGDGLPSSETPRIAILLAESFGGTLRHIRSETGTERELVFGEAC
jgi:two-component system, sensor histidine kinase PdtaS